MSGTQEKNTKDMEALSELLENTLGEFNEKPVPPARSTDDDLDEFLAPLDAAATQKAAENFERILHEISVPQAINESAITTVGQNLDDSESLNNPSYEFLSDLLGIKQFLDDESTNPNVRGLIESVLKECFTTEFMLPLVQQFKQLVDEYLIDEDVQMNTTDRNSLISQQQTFGELIHAYEESANPPTSKDVEHQNQLWTKLRDLGDIPQELILRFDTTFQPSGGLPGIPQLGVAESENCSIM